jgi:TFIIF-interacting CTD phosphatase-like protein
MEKLDPKKKIKYILSREHCIVINKCYYIKSIRDLGRDQQNVIVVDVFYLVM